MKKIYLLFTVPFLFCTVHSSAQNKIGFISLDEVVALMPEYKKADTALAEYNNTLSQTFNEYRIEFLEQDSILNSKDTLKFTKAQIIVKREQLVDLQTKIQHFGDQAQQMLNQKSQELLAPIQRKALEALRIVSKENGYNFVFEKHGLYIYPDAEDLLPLVKKKLNLK